MTVRIFYVNSCKILNKSKQKLGENNEGSTDKNAKKA